LETDHPTNKIYRFESQKQDVHQMSLNSEWIEFRIVLFWVI